MEYKIDNRMQYILDSDKISNPNYICKILKEEIEPIIKNYLVTKNDVDISFTKSKNNNIFTIKINAERIKKIGYIP